MMGAGTLVLTRPRREAGLVTPTRRDRLRERAVPAGGPWAAVAGGAPAAPRSAGRDDRGYGVRWPPRRSPRSDGAVRRTVDTVGRRIQRSVASVAPTIDSSPTAQRHRSAATSQTPPPSPCRQASREPTWRGMVARPVATARGPGRRDRHVACAASTPKARLMRGRGVSDASRSSSSSR